MSRVKHRKCDICDEKLGHSTHLRIKRLFLYGWVVRLVDWGMKDISPVTEGWRKLHVDLCSDCWSETKEVVRERVE